MDEIKDFLDKLDSSDLHALSAEEKRDLFQMLKSACCTTHAQIPIPVDYGTSEVTYQIEELKEKVNQIHASLLKASGNACSDPETFRDFLTKYDYKSGQRSPEDILLGHISSLGLEYSIPTPGNGDCFFEAVSDQLQRLGRPKQSAHDLRSNVALFCRQNPVLKQNKGLVNLKDFVEGRNLTTYLDKMSRKGEWADHLIVMATASCLDLDILVVTSTPDASLDECLIWIHSGKSENDVAILGHIFENHYQSLRPITKESEADPALEIKNERGKEIEG